MRVDKTKQVAAIANHFIQHARYKLTPREQKLILYMATLIRQEDSGFETYLVPVAEIEDILKSDSGKKHGSFYERLDDLLDSITDKKITFPTGFTIDGVRMRGHINWVAGAVPKYDPNGTLCVEFGFSPQMKPFLLGLKERFTKIEFMEVAKMKSGFSIRIFQMCKSYYYENIRHGRDTLKVGIKELKQRLGVPNKYPDFRNFRRKVLSVAQKEINLNTRLDINFEFKRSGRRIAEIHIVISEKGGGDEEGDQSSEVELLSPGVNHGSEAYNKGRVLELTEAKRRAFNMLMDYGVNINIALDEIMTLIRGSELEGYEDYFVFFMLEFFENKTNRRSQKEKVKAFIGWIRNDHFSEPGLYAALCEKVIDKKKGLTDQERDNRERAKHMTAAAFRQLLEEEQFIGQQKEFAPSVQTKLQQEKEKVIKKNRRKAKFSTPSKSAEYTFDLQRFRTRKPDIYNRILRERKAAFIELEGASSYDQLLSNSVAAYCEKWESDHPEA